MALRYYNHNDNCYMCTKDKTRNVLNYLVIIRSNKWIQ